MINQINMLLAFFITGIIIGILFDIFRISRKLFKTPNILIYIEDILFWILTGLFFLFTIFTFTNGQIRLYMIIITICACIIYFISISKYFITLNIKIANIILNILKIMFFPMKKIKKLINFTKNSGKWRILCYNVEIDI